MADIIACLSTGKGTWSEVLALINAEEWDNIYLITNDFGKEKFKHETAQLIALKKNTVKEMSDEIYEALKGKVSFNDVAVNMISGNGKEHMALITAVLKLGVGIRFVSTENGKLIEI